MIRISTSRVWGRRVSATGVLVFAGLLSGCIDFGFRLANADTFVDAGVDAPAPPVDAGDGDAAEADAGAPEDGGGDVDAGPSCVEGAVPPSDIGPQIQFTTLNVDRPIVMITAGDTLTWTNTDSMRHTVTNGAPGAITPAARGGFTSGDVASGSRWAYRFCNPRTVIWFCETHPAQMNGYRIVIGG